LILVIPCVVLAIMYVHQHMHTKELSVIHKLHPPTFFSDKTAMPEDMSMYM